MVLDDRYIVGPSSRAGRSACLECLLFHHDFAGSTAQLPERIDADYPAPNLYLSGVVLGELTNLSNGHGTLTLGHIVSIPLDGRVPRQVRVWQVEHCNTCAAAVEMELRGPDGD